MILMKVYTFQFQWFTIQDKSTLCIKCDVADTSCGLIDINHLAVQTDTRFHLIEIRIGCAPQMRFTDLDTLLAPYGLFGFQTKCRGLTFANLLSVSIEQALYDFTLLDSQTAITDFCLNEKSGLRIRLLEICIYKCAKGGHADLCRLLQPCVTIDAGALIKPAFLK